MRKLVVSSLFSLLILAQAGAAAAAPLNPRKLTKYLDPLPAPAVIDGASGMVVQVTMSEFAQQLHSQLPPTTLWGYAGSYPGPTIHAIRGIPTHVRWVNALVDPVLQARLPVDETLHWADPLCQGPSFDQYFGPVPTSVHLHGGETESASDGHPEAWFTPFFTSVGPGWVKETLRYDNTQEATTLWYHDHALGTTRLNVYGGLAGFYLLRDPAREPAGLPSGAYEREIVIQDRLFDTDGQLRYTDDVVNPTIHPFWAPEFFGDTILANGKVWPYLSVEPRKYRFHLLNGSNARFYDLQLGGGVRFWQIGTDGGYLDHPVEVRRLLLAPGERADVVVDFSAFLPDEKILLRNLAKAPYPGGTAPDPQTVGQIMQFRVVPPSGPDTSVVPPNLRPANPIVRLSSATVTRTLTLNEVEGPGGPLGAVLDGKMWDYEVTETPAEGTTELWEIVNLTEDAHPIHLHLVQFQLLERQAFQVDKYRAAYDAANPIIPVPMDASYTTVPVTSFLQGAPTAPDANEMGWKDTLRMNPGQVTRILVRFAPTDTPSGESGLFSFDPSAGPGYVWHCHILEHEDNEMMRPYQVVAATH
jgi:FtsP/CotA-like multicopper oxidase with cupredoxin domain